MHKFLLNDTVSSEELVELLSAREAGEADFLLVDVREEIEYNMGHIKGVDLLKPTSEFQEWGEAMLKEYKDKTLIFTCRTGARSGQVQNIFGSNGHEHVINHVGGILSFRGEIEK